MIFLIEGVDKTGKTTLTTALAEAFPDLERRKHSTMHSSYDALMASQRILAGISTNKNYLFDRFYYPADLIYGPIVGGYEHSHWVMNKYHADIMPMLQENDVHVILCVCDNKILAERFVREAEEYATVEQITAIQDSYLQWFNKIPRGKRIVLDSSLYAPAEMFDIAKAYIEGVLKGAVSK